MQRDVQRPRRGQRGSDATRESQRVVLGRETLRGWVLLGCDEHGAIVESSTSLRYKFAKDVLH